LTELLAKIVECAGDFHDHIFKSPSRIPKDIFNDMAALNARNRMFNDDP